MKLKQQVNGSWVVKSRPYFTLIFCVGILTVIPEAYSETGEFALIGIIILLSSLALYYLAEFSSLEVAADKITYRRNFLLFCKVESFSRDDFKSVNLDYNPTANSGGSRLKFSFSHGETIVFPKVFIGSTIGWTMSELLRSFKLILEDSRESGDEILSMLESGNKVKAIEITRKKYGMALKEAKEFVEQLEKVRYKN